MKTIKILKTELQIGDQKIMLSMDEMKELKRVLSGALPEDYSIQYIPYQNPCPFIVTPEVWPPMVTDDWGTSSANN